MAEEHPSVSIEKGVIKIGPNFEGFPYDGVLFGLVR